jgi:transposase
LCGARSRRIHSRYDRQVADLPCAGKQIRLRVITRRFVCEVPHCRPSRYKGYIANLPPDLQEFFENEWRDYDATRSELKWRIRLVLENELVRTIFSAPRTRLNVANVMDTGKVLVVDNSIEKLDQDGSAFLGRFILAQVWSAAMARQSTPRHQRKPVFVYVDEAHKIIDHTVTQIIDMCRSANIALIISHQRPDQIEDSNVLSALENCAIKMANVDADASYFSKLLHMPTVNAI